MMLLLSTNEKKKEKKRKRLVVLGVEKTGQRGGCIPGFHRSGRTKFSDGKHTWELETIRSLSPGIGPQQDFTGFSYFSVQTFRNTIWYIQKKIEQIAGEDR